MMRYVIMPKPEWPEPIHEARCVGAAVIFRKPLWYTA